MTSPDFRGGGTALEEEVHPDARNTDDKTKPRSRETSGVPREHPDYDPDKTGYISRSAQREQARRMGLLTDRDRPDVSDDEDRGVVSAETVHTTQKRDWKKGWFGKKEVPVTERTPLLVKNQNVAGQSFYDAHIHDVHYKNLNANATMYRQCHFERGKISGPKSSGYGSHVTESLIEDFDLSGLGRIESLRGTTLVEGSSLQGLNQVETDMRDVKFRLRGQSRDLTAKDLLDMYELDKAGKKTVERLLYSLFKDMTWSDATQMDDALKVLLDLISDDYDKPLPKTPNLNKRKDFKKQMKDNPLFQDATITESSDGRNINIKIGESEIDVNFTSDANSKNRAENQLDIVARGFDFEQMQATRELFKRFNILGDDGDAATSEDPSARASKKAQFGEAFFIDEGFAVMSMFVREAYRIKSPASSREEDPGAHYRRVRSPDDPDPTELDPTMARVRRVRSPDSDEDTESAAGGGATAAPGAAEADAERRRRASTAFGANPDRDEYFEEAFRNEEST